MQGQASSLLLLLLLRGPMCQVPEQQPLHPQQQQQQRQHQQQAQKTLSSMFRSCGSCWPLVQGHQLLPTVLLSHKQGMSRQVWVVAPHHMAWPSSSRRSHQSTNSTTTTSSNNSNTNSSSLQGVLYQVQAMCPTTPCSCCSSQVRP
jgi:hypothetical protein